MAESFLSLTEAARRLGVHSATLRRWADRGEIPVTFTAGGHRRFDAGDVTRFIEAQRQEGAQRGLTHWRENAVVHTRHQLQARAHEAWLDGLTDDARARSREMGKRLMGLLLTYISAPGSPEVMEPEVQALGHAYGRHSRDAGLTVSMAMQATVFFRDALFDSTLHASSAEHALASGHVRLLRRLNRFVNIVQLAIAETYNVDGNVVLPRA